MPDNPNFSLIIPNYNGANFISDCLNSIAIAIKNCPSSKFEIIIVDNGSTDNSIKLIKNLNLPNTKYLIQNTNHGFAYAVNQGINKSKYNYVVLVNNDITLKSDWFKQISQSIIKNNHPQIISYFGTILNKEGTKYESQGLKYFASGKCLNISNDLKFSKSKTHHLQSTKLIWGGSGALIVYQKEIIKKIGNFDPDFFAYLEDVDVAFRLNKFGYKTLYTPQAISYHLGGGTSNHMNNFRYRMDVRNWFYLIIKNYSTKDFWLNFFPILVERLRNLSCLIKKSFSVYKLKSFWLIPKDIFQIYFEVFKNFSKMRQKYHQTQKLLKSTK
jgi:GT2 family glycosyltransferase